MTRFFIELIQDPREARADALEALQGGLSSSIRMQVPKKEFYSAVLHFKDRKTVELFKSMEEKYPNLMASLLGVSMGRYMQEMFKEGRWKDKDDEGNLHIIGG